MPDARGQRGGWGLAAAGRAEGWLFLQGLLLLQGRGLEKGDFDHSEGGRGSDLAVY